MAFLSTPSARRATTEIPCVAFCVFNFYPRPPRGGRPVAFPLGIILRSISIHALREEGDPGRSGCNGDIKISIHALREEGDYVKYLSDKAYGKFLSTPSARRATMLCRSANSATLNFYPRPPRGGRHDAPLLLQYGVGISIHALREEGDAPCRHPSDRPSNFYPRPPRGGRRRRPHQRPAGGISIHALREEGDL